MAVLLSELVGSIGFLDDAKLSTAEAEELLGLSEPFVARLLESGELPSEVLPHGGRRVQQADMLVFQSRRERRWAGRREVSARVESEGLPY